MILNLCAINTQLAVGALTSLRFNHTVEAEILELSSYQASIGLPRLTSLGPVPERAVLPSQPAWVCEQFSHTVPAEHKLIALKTQAHFVESSGRLQYCPTRTGTAHRQFKASQAY